MYCYRRNGRHVGFVGRAMRELLGLLAALVLRLGYYAPTGSAERRSAQFAARMSPILSKLRCIA